MTTTATDNSQAITTTPVCFDLFIAKLKEFVDFSDNAPIGFSTKTRNIYEDCDPDYFSGEVRGEYTVITIRRRDTSAPLLRLTCSDRYYENEDEQTLGIRADVVDWTGKERYGVIHRYMSIPHGGSNFIAREEIAEVALQVSGMLREAGLAKS